MAKRTSMRVPNAHVYTHVRRTEGQRRSRREVLALNGGNRIVWHHDATQVRVWS